MATADRVVVELEARMGAFETRIRSAERNFDRSMGRIKGSAGGAEQAVTRAFGSMGSALGLAAGVAGALALAKGFLAIADAAKSLDASLRLATAGYGSYTQAQQDVQRIAAETRSGLAETGKLYGTLMRAAVDLGISQREAAIVTETLTKTFTISGAGAQEAANATRQLIQGLQSGTLRGDEFNSVMEQAPRLAKVMADGLGIPIGQLRAMAEEGKLSGEAITSAVIKAREQIDAEFAEMPVTFGQAMTLVSNAAQITFGAFDRGGEFSTALANFITQGSEGFGTMEKDAEDAGIEIRAVLGALGDVFTPMVEGAKDAFAFIAGEAQPLVDQIASLLGAIDRVKNFNRNMAQGAANKLEDITFGLIPAGYAGDKSDYEGQFRRSVERRRGEGKAKQDRRTYESWRESGMFASGLGFAPQEEKRPPPPKRTTKPTKGTKGAASANAEVGREWSADEVADMLRKGGFRITDVNRTAAEQQAQIDKWLAQEARKPGSGGLRPAAVGTSAHEKGLGVDIGKEHSVASIKAFLKSKGVPIGKLLNEGDHKHLQIGGKGRGKSAEQIAADAARKAEQEEARQQRFRNELAGLNGQLLDARRALLVAAEAIEQAERDDVELSRKAYATEVQSQVVQGDITEAEAKQLLLVNEQLATERLKLIERRKQERLFKEQTAAAERELSEATASLQNQTDLIEAKAGEAKTAAERRAVELRLLELAFQREKLELEAITALSRRIAADANASPEEKAAAASNARIAQGRLDTLPQRKDGAKQDVERNTQGPLEAYRDKVNKTGAEINEELEGVVVGGLQSLEDGLVDVLMGTKDLSTAFKEMANQIIAQLIRIAIQKYIIDTIAGAMGAGTAASPRAVGGGVTAGRPYLVGERGPELMVPGGNGTVVPNNSLARMAGSSGGGAVVQLQVTAGEMFEARVVQVAGEVSVQTVRSAAPALTDMAVTETSRRMGRKRL